MRQVLIQRWIYRPSVQIHIVIWSTSMRHCWKCIMPNSFVIGPRKPHQSVRCMMNWRPAIQPIRIKKPAKAANRTKRIRHRIQVVKSEKWICVHRPISLKRKHRARAIPMKSVINSHKPKRHFCARLPMAKTSLAFMMKHRPSIRDSVIVQSKNERYCSKLKIE